MSAMQLEVLEKELWTRGKHDPLAHALAQKLEEKDARNNGIDGGDTPPLEMQREPPATILVVGRSTFHYNIKLISLMVNGRSMKTFKLIILMVEV